MSSNTSPNEGLPPLADYLVTAPLVTDEALNCCLFVNNYTPVAGSVLADFDEASFSGYQRVAIYRSDWLAPALVGDVAEVRLSISPPRFTFTGTGSVNVFGCFLLGGLTNLVYYARRFAPFRVLYPGASVIVNPVIKLRSAVVA